MKFSMKKYVYILLITLAVLIPITGKACMFPKGVERAFYEHDFVFIGMATRVESFPNHEIAEFTVNKSWKGANTQKIKIYNASHYIQESSSYLIFAKKKEGSLYPVVVFGGCSESSYIKPWWELLGTREGEFMTDTLHFLDKLSP